MQLEGLLLAVAGNDGAMAALPEDVRKEIASFRALNEKRVKEEERLRKEQEEAARKAREEAEAARRKELAVLLCKGEWGEKVPLERRFALCESDNKSPDDIRKKVYCAIDLVRGYKSPYWGYFCCGSPQKEMDTFYKERIKPVFDAKTEEDLGSFLRCEYDTFRVDRYDAQRLFTVLDYDVDDNGHVVVKGRSEEKVFSEHQKALQMEWGPLKGD